MAIEISDKKGTHFYFKSQSEASEHASLHNLFGPVELATGAGTRFRVSTYEVKKIPARFGAVGRFA